MRRNTALWLYRLLFVTQILGLCLGLVKTITLLNSGVYTYLPACLVGFVVGTGLAVLWFRNLKAVEATSEEQWNHSRWRSILSAMGIFQQFRIAAGMKIGMANLRFITAGPLG